MGKRNRAVGRAKARRCVHAAVSVMEPRVLYSYAYKPTTENFFTDGGGGTNLTANLGATAGSYDLWYQTGGTSTYSSVSLGSTANARCSLIVKGGNLTVGTGGITVGNNAGGYGEFTAGDGAVSTTGNLTLLGSATAPSFYSQSAGGSTNVSGLTNVTAGTTLVVTGGSFQTGTRQDSAIVTVPSSNSAAH